MSGTSLKEKPLPYINGAFLEIKPQYLYNAELSHFLKVLLI
jgi:hypothetical protein